jgi:hypothetical protein
LVGNPERKRQLGRPRHGCEYYIRMDVREMGWEDVDWLLLVQGRLGSCERGNEPSGSIKGRVFIE